MKYKVILAIYLTLISSVVISSPQNQGNEKAEKLLNLAKTTMTSDLDKAEEYILEALNIAPEHTEVNFYCGQIMALQANDAFFTALSYAESSLECLSRAVKNQPSNIKYRKGLMSFYLGAPYIAGGDEDLAWAQVEAIQRIDPIKGVSAELNFYKESEQEEKYAQKLLESTHQFPKVAEFQYRQGLMLQTSKQYAKAIKLFEHAVIVSIENNADNTEHYLYNSYYQIGRTAVFSKSHLEKGISALKLFVKADVSREKLPPLDWAYLRLAQLYKLKNDQSSVDYYKNLASQSDDPELHEALEEF